MSLWNESLNTFAASWLETLVRVCWQGGLALALVWAVCRLLPRLPAAGRCWLWRLAYLKLLVALLWLPTVDLPLLPPADPAPPATLLSLPPDVLSPAAISADSLSPEPPRTGAPPAVVPTVAGWLLLLWTAGLLRQGGQAIRQSLTVRRLRRSGTPLNGGPLDFWNLALSRDLNLASVPRLLSSTATDTPLLIGILQPCIVLPEALLSTCTQDELRLILAHELAHIRRRDLLWGWLPLLTRFVCGFHPLVCLAEREVGMAQEIACDETALHLTGAPSVAYGSLLVRVAARFAPRSSQGFGMIGMTESYHTLKRRLSAMKSFPSAPRHYRVAIRFGMLTLGLAALIPWRVAAQATPPVPAPPAPTAPIGIPPVPAPPSTTPPVPATPGSPVNPTTPVPTAPQVNPVAPVPTTPQANPGVVPATPSPQGNPIAAPAAETQGLPITADPSIAPTTSPASNPVVTATVGRRSARAARRSAPATSQDAYTTSPGGVAKDAATATSAAISRDVSATSARARLQRPGMASTVARSRNSAMTSTDTVSRSARDVSTVTVSQESSEGVVSQGYPMAAPGMISAPKSATTSTSRSASPQTHSIGIAARDSRRAINPPPSAASVRALPDPNVRNRAARSVKPIPSRAASDPFATPSPRKEKRRSTDEAPQALPNPGVAPTDPFVRPPAAAPTDPTATPEARSISIPADPTLSSGARPEILPTDPVETPPAALPGDPGAVPANSIRIPAEPTLSLGAAPEGLPTDPVETPSVSVPEASAPETSEEQGTVAPARSHGVPFLSDIPILGRLFRYTQPDPVTPDPNASDPGEAPAPAASRGIPVLSDIPILGRLFRYTPTDPVTPDPDQPTR